MIELRFPGDLYDADAVSAAIEAFSPFADCERESADDGLLVRIKSKGAHEEGRIADELANFALGLTIEGQRGTLG